MKAIRGIVLVCAILPGMAFAQLHVFSPLGNAVLEPFQVQPVIPDCMDLTQTQTVIHTGVNSATGQVHQAVCWDLVNDVIYIPNLWCNHQEGCGGGAVGITGTGTQNFVAKFMGPHVIEDASGFDDGTNPVTWPNGFSSQDNGLYNTDPNSASPGTAVGLAACESTAGTLHTCLTSDKNNLAGVAEFGAGTTGSVEVCTTKCLATFDNTPVPGHWAILSPTVIGDFHDTGSTSPTGIFQQFVFVDSASPPTVKIMTPDVIGVANSIKNTIEFNEIASFPVADFNATTPAADSGFIASTWKTSSTANTTSAIAEVPFGSNSTKGVIQADGSTCTITAGVLSCTGSGSGISEVDVPSDMYQNSPCTGPSCHFTKQNQNAGFFWRGPQVPTTSFSTPFLIQKSPTTCTASIGATVVNCNFFQPTTAASLVYITVDYDNSSPTHVSTIVLNPGSISCTSLNSVAANNAMQSYYCANVPAGETGVTVTMGINTIDIGVRITEYGNVATASPVDTTINSFLGICNSAFTLLNFANITNGNPDDILVATAMSGNNNLATYSASPGITLNGQTNSVFTFGDEFRAVNSISTYNLPLSCSGGAPTAIYGMVDAFKALNTTPPSVAPWSSLPIFFPDLTLNAFPGLSLFLPSSSIGDTQIDLHQGIHIVQNAVTSSFAGSGAGSTLVLSPNAGAATGYFCTVSVKCNTAVATATVLPGLVYTSDDSASTVMTENAPTSALCTTLGTADHISFLDQIHVKPNTTVFVKTTIANSPNYNIDTFCSVTTTQ